MENEGSVERLKILDAINELLARREAKEEGLREVNRILRQGFETAKCFPMRWYVKNPNQKVLDYLNKKYNRNMKVNPDEQAAGLFCGYGEAHGEFAFVPHDIDYSWKITQEEFDLIMILSSIKKK